MVKESVVNVQNEELLPFSARVQELDLSDEMKNKSCEQFLQCRN